MDIHPLNLRNRPAPDTYRNIDGRKRIGFPNSFFEGDFGIDHYRNRPAPDTYRNIDEGNIDEINVG